MNTVYKRSTLNYQLFQSKEKMNGEEKLSRQPKMES